LSLAAGRGNFCQLVNDVGADVAKRGQPPFRRARRWQPLGLWPVLALLLLLTPLQLRLRVPPPLLGLLLLMMLLVLLFRLLLLLLLLLLLMLLPLLLLLLLRTLLLLLLLLVLMTLLQFPRPMLLPLLLLLLRPRSRHQPLLTLATPSDAARCSSYWSRA